MCKYDTTQIARTPTRNTYTISVRLPYVLLALIHSQSCLCSAFSITLSTANDAPLISGVASWRSHAQSSKHLRNKQKHLLFVFCLSLRLISKPLVTSMPTYYLLYLVVYTTMQRASSKFEVGVPKTLWTKVPLLGFGISLCTGAHL